MRTAKLLNPLAVVAVIGVVGFLFLRGVAEGFKQEAGIQGAVIFQSKRIEQTAPCGKNGSLRGFWLYSLVSGLGGTVEELRAPGNSPSHGAYLVTLQGKRVLVRWRDSQPWHLPQRIDGEILINHAGYSKNEVQLDPEPVLEILGFAYPGIDAKITEFDWRHNVCTVTLSQPASH